MNWLDRCYKEVVRNRYTFKKKAYLPCVKLEHWGKRITDSLYKVEDGGV
jgi:hypothetical protein